MKLLACSIRDSAVDSFMRPFYVRSTGEAVRAFTDSVNGSENSMKAHPDDYELYHIGFFDEEAGKLEPLVKNLMLIRAKDCSK